MPRPALAWLASSAAVGLLILGYLAAHLAVRLLTSPTLGIDDAEQALLAQRFAWGYQIREPPLYTWLLLPVMAAVGPTLLALSLVRYLLLGVTFFCMYAVARRWIVDPRLAALAVFSFAAIYMFGYYAHHDLTNSTALAAAIAATFYAFARLVERPGAARYLMLGVCFGLGLLAKWNFVMLALGLPLTCLLHRRFRALVLDPRALLAVAAMALVAAPSGLWALGQEQSALASAHAVLGDQPGHGFWATLAVGTAALARAALVYPLPFVALFLLAFGRALWRGRPAGDPAPGEVGAPAVTPGFMGGLIAVVLGLHWLLIPTVGAVAFTEHWLHPALMVLPILLFALAERGEPTPGACRTYLALLGVLVIGCARRPDPALHAWRRSLRALPRSGAVRRACGSAARGRLRARHDRHRRRPRRRQPAGPVSGQPGARSRPIRPRSGRRRPATASVWRSGRPTRAPDRRGCSTSSRRRSACRRTPPGAPAGSRPR